MASSFSTLPNALPPSSLLTTKCSKCFSIVLLHFLFLSLHKWNWRQFMDRTDRNSRKHAKVIMIFHFESDFAVVLYDVICCVHTTKSSQTRDIIKIAWKTELTCVSVFGKICDSENTHSTEMGIQHIRLKKTHSHSPTNTHFTIQTKGVGKHDCGYDALPLNFIHLSMGVLVKRCNNLLCNKCRGRKWPNNVSTSINSIKYNAITIFEFCFVSFHLFGSSKKKENV